MAVVNAQYEFIYVNVGTNGRVSDGGVFQNSAFGRKLFSDQLHLPGSDTNFNLNYVFVADDAFPLHKHIMKPFPHKNLTAEQKIYNYRLSRARCIVENVFGILAARFRIFRTEINLKPEKVDCIILTACTLHNFLRRNCPNTYTPPNFVDCENVERGEIEPGMWRTGSSPFESCEATRHKNSTNDAKQVRIQYQNYFNGPGAVSWQESMISRGRY